MNKLNQTAIVTGASRGIGSSISKMLIERGYDVIGCSRFPEKSEFTHPHFRLDKIDLTDLKQLQSWVTNINSIENLSLLIHNAGKGYFAPLEELSWSQIQTMNLLHLTVPMLLTNSLLRILKKNEGRILLIGSIAGIQVSPWGSVYGASKAGLIHFGREIFQELRKSGVKVTNLIPDLTDTSFYDDLNFGLDEDPKSHLLGSCISSAIENILEQRDGTVISEIILQPEKFKIKKKNKK